MVNVLSPLVPTYVSMLASNSKICEQLSARRCCTTGKSMPQLLATSMGLDSSAAVAHM